MNISEYALYCLAVVVMIATPGPVILLVASAGLKGGFSKALQTIFGTNFASLILISLSILILKGFLHIGEQWFILVKALGCLCILYLGIQIIREVMLEQLEGLSTNSSVTGGFKQGFLVGISNPKDIIFFAAFFPQFVGITSNLNLSLAILTLSWIILDFLTLSLVYLSFKRLSGSKIYPKILACCGLILVLIAIYGIYAVFSAILH